MKREDLVKELAIKTGTKIVLLVLDGLGGLPRAGKTELEAARKPNLDRLAASAAGGLTDPVFRGITPGSGPAHLALFGYDPLRYQLGRGILEALGEGVEVGRDDLVARGNFATLRGGLVVDRRAGRIPTSANEILCEKLNVSLPSRGGISIRLYPGKEHRFVVRFTGPGLSEAVSDADPQKENKPPVSASPLADEANKTAAVVNDFIRDASEILKDSTPANTVLIRGFSKFPDIPTLAELYKLNPAAVANYPMYKGLAKLLGMAVFDAGPEATDLVRVLETIYPRFDFFYVHYKKTDTSGEDGDFEAKVSVIERFDRELPRVLALEPDVLVVTSDHSTPALWKAHSWHPNPFLLFAKSCRVDGLSSFSEKECGRGSLGRFESLYALPLMLAHAGKLMKYGA
jgi:2,3-bisphosphoglycerate-independent phosphoglycerate mutase